jgi:two-component system, cell cycle sensor histidine kinase and response regulator CckA
MRTVQTSDANQPRLQLLMAGGSEKEFADLRDVCASVNDGRLHLEHAADPDDVLGLIEKGTYDLLLCSGNSTDDALLQLLRQVREHDSRIPLIVLADQTSEAVIAVVTQSGICRDAAKNRPTKPCKQQAELQQAQRMETIGRLASGVAHDFNNLLLIIGGYAELTLDSLGAKDPLRRNVNEIMTASRRAADLTRQLLSFGRKQAQSPQVLDLNPVIGEIANMLPRLIGENIELVFAPGLDLGKVKADPVQIEQIIMNLAANARDAMPAGGMLTIETASVRVDEFQTRQEAIIPADDYVLLTVTDSGEGIAAQHLAHIFEPFYTTKDPGKGTGLGLATVYDIVKQNGGFICVCSEPRVGTTFKIYLPRVFSRITEICGSEMRLGKPFENSPRGCETVLLVDDDTFVRQVSREFLIRRGYNVIEASDGEDALRASRKHNRPIHLLITDAVMPRMGGAKLAELLADERPDMKVLFVSGYAGEVVLTRDISTHFLQKPFSLRVMARKVQEVLGASAERLLTATSHG